MTSLRANWNQTIVQEEKLFVISKKKTTGRKGNVPDSFKLLSKTLTYSEAGNHLQIHLGNSPDRVWKKGDFWEKYVLLHFSSPTEHMPVFPTLQTPHSWHSKSCPRTFLFCTDTPPQRPWGHTTLAPRPVPQGLCPSEPFSTQKWFLSAWYCTAIGPGAISLELALSHGPARTLLLSLCLRNQQGKWENPDKQKPSSSTKSRLRKTQRTEQRSLKADF